MINEPADSKDNTLNRIDRRKFFKVLGGGLAVAFVFEDIYSLAEETSVGLVADSEVAAWIHIGEDGVVSVFTGKVEVGQNIRTSLSQLVAEELYIPVSSIKMVMGDTDLVPFDAGTFGSRSTPQMGTQLRRAAATARHALLEMAAAKWNTTKGSLLLEEGIISDPQSGKKVGFGELTSGKQMLLPISNEISFIPASDWKVAGTTVPKVNGRQFITGRHQYVSDMKLPDMLYGKVLRPPSYNARLVDVDLKTAKALPGVFVFNEDSFIAVAAPTLQRAEKALSVIKANWAPVKQPSQSEIFEYLVQNVTNSNSRDPNEGIQKGMAEAEMKHEATYTVEYIAHVPLEPRAALADWKPDKLTVWTGTQRPFGVQQDLASNLDMPKEKVRVIMPDTGSAYGGKHSGEAAVEAARLSKAFKRPVKLVWTRKEEFTWAYFRPAGVIKINSGFKKDGSITAWKFDNYNSGNAGLATQYRIANQQVAYHPSRTPLKQGSYRGLASTANVFARESHIADIARMLDVDQLEFRIKNIDEARLKAVLEAAAKSFGWNSLARSKGRGYGIACGFEKGGYVATCAEIEIGSNKSVRVIRLTEAFECGSIVNPHHLENQILGSVVQGIGGALFESINFEDGKILNSSLSAYRVPRFRDVPKIEIVMLNRQDLPSAGAGEAAIVTVAPAIRNAILDASGVKLTTLPLIPTGKLA